jgi:hypothetical protein
VEPTRLPAISNRERYAAMLKHGCTEFHYDILTNSNNSEHNNPTVRFTAGGDDSQLSTIRRRHT